MLDWILKGSITQVLMQAKEHFESHNEKTGAYQSKIQLQAKESSHPLSLQYGSLSWHAFSTDSRRAASARAFDLLSFMCFSLVSREELKWPSIQGCRVSSMRSTH